MKKLLKQLLAVTTAIMMAITLLPAMANAEENSAEVPGFRIKKIAQKEKETDAEIPLQGAEFKYYKVYDINETTGEITINNKFRVIQSDTNATQLWTDLNNMIDETKNFTTTQELTLANDLKNYIAKNGISAEMKEGEEGDILTSGANGLTNYAANKTHGYYLIVETKAPKAPKAQAPDTYITGDPFFLAFPGTDETNGTRIYDVTSKPKANAKGISGPDKKILTTDNSEGVSANDVRVGDYIKYQIKVTVPQFTDKSFDVTDNMPKITITDEMSKNLTFVNDDSHPVTVTVNNLTKTAEQYNLTPGTKGSDNSYTAFTAILQANNGFTKDDRGKDVIITYYAKVEAVDNSIASDLQNLASVKVNDDSDILGGQTDSYTYGIELTKTLAGKNLTKDQKVYFDLYEKKDRTYTKVTDLELNNVVSANKTTGNDIGYGQFFTTTIEKDNKEILKPIRIEGLSLGEYALKETKTVGGYTLLTKYVEFNLVDENSDGLPDGKLDNAKGENTDSNILSKTVDNKKGFTMPTTGGMGTYIFTIGGLVVMVGAVLLLVSSKKKRA